jgi:hypothetical protein
MIQPGCAELATSTSLIWMRFGTSDHIFNIHDVQLIIIFISLTKIKDILSYSCLELRLERIWWNSPGCMVGVLMSVVVMTVGVMSVGEITVGVMTCGTCYAHEFNLNAFRHEWSYIQYSRRAIDYYIYFIDENKRWVLEK